MTRISTFVIFALLASVAGICRGQESLEERLAKLEAAMAAVKTNATAQAKEPNSPAAAEKKKPSASQTDPAKPKTNALAAVKAPATSAEAPAKAPEDKKSAIELLPDWVKKVKLSGDLRYRYESIDDATYHYVRYRNRIRARLGLDAAINDEWSLGFRVATSEGSSGGDPVSTNQTLDGASSKKTFWLDLAYFTYRPSWMKGFSLVAGKMPNPFYAVGKNQLVWDHDLTPEGGALVYTGPLNDKTSVNLAGGAFWINEESSGQDTYLMGAQAYLKHQIDKPTYVLGGLGWYDYSHIQGMETLSLEWKGSNDFFGNTSAPGNVFASDYDEVELFAEVGTEIGKLPVAVCGNWVRNTAASTDEDTGWLIGGSINKIKDPGSWQFDYDYRDIELDAVIGQFNDSDFVGGGTGGKGHRFAFSYQLAKNVTLGVNYYLSQFSERKNDVDYDRFQADAQIKF